MGRSPKYKLSQDLGPPATQDKRQDSNRASEEDVQQLRRRIAALEEQARREREESEGFNAALASISERPKLAGHATPEGCRQFAAGFGAESVSFYRPAQDILISSLGIGTSPGARDHKTDLDYARAIHAALRGGVNLIDTSLNYRHQRSECAAATGLRGFIEDSRGARDAVVVCTKGGYLVPGAYSESALRSSDVEGGIHCMSPAFLADQIDRSRRNLGLETIDIYYLHNPEIQLKFIEMTAFMNRVRAAIDRLERAVSDGLVGYYGMATWDGYRNGALSLRAMVEAARQIAGDSHHFRFVQLPYNLEMQEARTCRVHNGGSVLDVAMELGITVISSRSLAQAHLSRNLPVTYADTPSALRTDAQRAIQFVRSTPGITSALVGMRDMAHVVENLEIARNPPLTAAVYQP